MRLRAVPSARRAHEEGLPVAAPAEEMRRWDAWGRRCAASLHAVPTRTLRMYKRLFVAACAVGTACIDAAQGIMATCAVGTACSEAV